MSDRKPTSSYNYTAIAVQDVHDDERLTVSMCCWRWIVLQWNNFIKCSLLRKLCRLFRKRQVSNNSDTPIKCTVTLPKCLMCWTFGWVFCLFTPCCFIFGKLESCFRFRFLHARGCRYVQQVEKSDDRYQQEAEKRKEECRNLNIRLSESQTEIQDLDRRLGETEGRLNDEREEKKDLLNKLSDWQTEVQNLERRFEEERREKDKALTRFEQERREKEKAQTRIEEERQEKEKALTRLSSIAGEKLRVNNPGIADLSDENRPNKLGEKFSELYDNEWTEVFESLEEENMDEEEIIKQLLDILKDVYTCCQQYAKAQRERLIQIITLPSRSEEQLQDAAMPEKVMSKVVDLQKQTASIALSDLKNKIIDTRSHLVDTKVKQTYTYRCMQLCWMMAIQDPPMALDFGPAQDEDFDRIVFRLYTQQGSRVAFIVWPAIYLHDNGPLVQKGVLQPVPS